MFAIINQFLIISSLINSFNVFAYNSIDQQQPNLSLLARGSSSIQSNNDGGLFGSSYQDPRIWRSDSLYSQRLSDHHQPQLDDYDEPELTDNTMNIGHYSRSKRSVPQQPYPFLPPLPPPPPIPPMVPFGPPPPPPPPMQAPPMHQPQASVMLPFMMNYNSNSYHNNNQNYQQSTMNNDYNNNYDNVQAESVNDQQYYDDNEANYDQSMVERRRYRPMYRKKYGEDCQYHTLVNGDSEIVLRKLFPLRMVGRTIVRHCMEKPNFNDPRYKVLLKGNQKSSFGSIRLQMVQ